MMVATVTQERYIISGHSHGGGALLIPMKAAQWHFEAKMADL